MAISAIVPIIAVGWFYGQKSGIYAGIFSFPVNILMYHVFETSPTEEIMLNGRGILGTFSLILIGAVIGRVRDLSIQLKKHHDKLDELVKIKTDEVHLSNQAVTETKDYLDNIIESSLDGITVSDHLGHVTRVNKAFLELIGLEEEVVVGKHIMELSVMNEGTYESSTGELVKINEEFFNTNMEMTVKLYEEGKVSNWESYYLRKDGKIVPVEMKIANLYNEHGDNTGAVGISRCITERKIAEKEIKEAKEFLENIFRTTTDGIIVTDHEGVITVVNEATANMLGYSKEEIVGKDRNIFEPAGEEYEKNSITYVTRLLEEGMVTGFEFIWEKKDGNLITVEANAALLKDNDGTLTGAVSTIRDITERIRAEKEIKEARDFLKSVIENSRDAILITDAWGTILSANTAMQQMSGFTKEELIGEHTSSLFSGDEELSESVMQKTEEMYEKGYAFYTSTMKTKDDRIIDLECSCSLVREDNEDVTAAVAIMRDVTERKNMENRLYQSEKLKSLGELAGGVAHDFNNVLAAILGRVQLLKMQFTPPAGKQEKRKAMLDLIKSLEIIERASLDGAETVRRIQEFARKRSDDKGFTQVNINELVDNALEFTGVRWKDDAEAKGIKINIQREFSPLPPTAGSASELREVFTNLINNALDAMPQGGSMKIKTSNENNHIAIAIEDTGIGIPEDMRSRIFDPFFTTKGVQSTGLGMSISYGIINRHHGTIVVNSSEGKGTTFTIKIPLSEKTTHEEGVLKKSEKEQRKANILVIEDEEEVRQLLYDVLISGGHKVEVASDGNQGLKLFETREFDLVFTDLGMPEMSGWEVAKRVKGINRGIPVAIITGWNVELEESEMKEREVNLIAHKPFEVNQILRLVQEGIRLKDKYEAA
jgi:PAS domain S-box-containing protein